MHAMMQIIWLIINKDVKFVDFNHREQSLIDPLSLTKISSNISCMNVF